MWVAFEFKIDFKFPVTEDFTERLGLCRHHAKEVCSQKIDDCIIILSIHQNPIFEIFACGFTDSGVDEGGIVMLLIKLHICFVNSFFQLSTCYVSSTVQTLPWQRRVIEGFFFP